MQDRPNYFREIVSRYRAFYRAAPKQGEPSADGCTRPVKLALDVLHKNPRMGDEELRDAIAASLSALLSQIHAHNATVGRYVLHGAEEAAAIDEFTRFFVDELFREAMGGDRARLAGNQMSMMLNTCNFVYRRMDDENRSRC